MSHPAEADAGNAASSDPELRVLKELAEGEARAQRPLARAAGCSLGLTNAILKRLITKGFVTARRVSGTRLAYAVTPEGTHEIARRTYRYLRRTIRHVVNYKEAVDALVAGARDRGVTTVLLRGGSDLAFLVEYAAEQHELVFAAEKAEQGARSASEAAGAQAGDGRVLVIAGEREPDAAGAEVHLREVLVGAVRVGEKPVG